MKINWKKVWKKSSYVCPVFDWGHTCNGFCTFIKNAIKKEINKQLNEKAKKS